MASNGIIDDVIAFLNLDVHVTKQGWNSRFSFCFAADHHSRFSNEGKDILFRI